jgi:hypothetical protein
MKIAIEKSVTSGAYYVKIVVKEISEDERLKIKKFGSPKVSLDPSSVLHNGQSVKNLSLHEINHYFLFFDQAEADQFAEIMRARLKKAADELRAKVDSFSGTQEYEF